MRVGKCDDAHTLQTMLVFNLLYRGVECALAALLSVQGQGDGNRRSSSTANDVE